MSRQAVTAIPSAWPALLTTELACAYVQLSEASFRFLAKRRGVKPADIAGLAVTRWRKADLDRMIDSLPTAGDQMPPQEPANGPGAASELPAHDPAAAALAKVAQRARKAGRG